MTSTIDPSVIASMAQLEQTYFTAEIAARMTALDLSQEFLATYAGFSQSELSKILSGTRPHDIFRANQIRRSLAELGELAELLYPIKIDFTDAQKIREAVRAPLLSLPNLFGAIAAAIKSMIAEESAE